MGPSRYIQVPVSLCSVEYRGDTPNVYPLCSQHLKLVSPERFLFPLFLLLFLAHAHAHALLARTLTAVLTFRNSDHR